MTITIRRIGDTATVLRSYTPYRRTSMTVVAPPFAPPLAAPA